MVGHLALNEDNVGSSPTRCSIWRVIMNKDRRPPCLNCGTKVNHSQSKYCSHTCNWQYKHVQFIKNWLAGEPVKTHSNDLDKTLSTHIRKHLFELNNSKCCKCGWNRINESTGLCPLHVNHIDGDCVNNAPSNLELICPSCHSLTANFSALNIGKGKRKIASMI
jgi:hypothetical protein